MHLHMHTQHTHTLHRCVIASVISHTVSLCTEHRFACIDQEVQLHLYHIHRRQHRQSAQSEAHHQVVSLPQWGRRQPIHPSQYDIVCTDVSPMYL